MEDRKRKSYLVYFSAQKLELGQTPYSVTGNLEFNTGGVDLDPVGHLKDLVVKYLATHGLSRKDIVIRNIMPLDDLKGKGEDATDTDIDANNLT